MLSFEDGLGRGSGRSIGDFHLLNAVSQCKDIVEEYGGHKRACGVKVKKERFAEFFDQINRVAKEMLVPEDFIPSLDIDLHIPLRELSLKLVEELALLEPFGCDNPQPLFCSTKVKVRSKAHVVASKHIKFWVSDEVLTCEAIGYNKAGVFPQFTGGEIIDVAYSPSVNTWGGDHSLQLKIEDVTLRSG
jgi:single-stranded-DNA-specific exonuclease